MRLAIVGIDALQNSLIAQKIQEFTGYPIISSMEDEMLDLLKLDTKKYFHAYQLHVLLDRCRQLQKYPDAILCDSLFTDICAVKAALQLKIINPLEADVYFSKQNEFNDFLMQCDHIFYVESDKKFLEQLVVQDDKFKGNLSLNYYMECYELYYEKLDSLRLKLKDRSTDINVQHADEVLATMFGKTEKAVLPVEVKEDIPEAKTESSIEEKLLAKLLEKDLQVAVLPNKEEVQGLISDFKEGINLEHAKYVSVDEDKIVCLKQVLVDDELSIACKVFASVEDAVTFLE